MRPTTVIVIGAGYAGVTAANRLRSSLRPEERVHVVMVNRTADFVERIRLHEVAAGTTPRAARPLSQMLHSDIEVVVGEAITIDPDQRTVEVRDSSGARLHPYDLLVYAVGSMAATMTTGAADIAFAVADPDRALGARSALAPLPPGAPVVVVGAGHTGVEAASEIAEQSPHLNVSLLGSSLLPTMTPAARSRIRRVLDRLGVDVVEDVRVQRVSHRWVELDDGTRVAAAVTIWAASFAAPPLAAESGLAVDTAGRLLVDETLRSTSHPDVVGAGDAVCVPASVGAHLRMSCAMAIPLGGQAADTVLAWLRSTTATPFSAGFLVQCVSLGRRRGYVQLVHADDSPRRFHLNGTMAARVKEQVCRLVVSGPRDERRSPDSIRTIPGPRRHMPSDPP